MSDLNVRMHSLTHKRFLSLLPSKYQQEDSNTLAISYFSLASLEILGTLKSSFTEKEISEFINHIYNHYIETEQYAGFKGSLTYLQNDESIELAATCFSLQCLLILNDDLHRINIEKIVTFVKSCQLPSGAFTKKLHADTSNDLRYCMLAMTTLKILLKDVEIIQNHIHFPSLQKYIWSLQTYDGGFSMSQGGESHAGMVFCAIAALKLMQVELTHDNNPNLLPLLDFLVHRQINFNRFNEQELLDSPHADMDDCGGFNGRWNKYADTCYVFWSLSSLKLLNLNTLIDSNSAREFLINKTQNLKMGGFNKTTDLDETPDPLHSFLGLAALSILKYPNLMEINCDLVIPHSSYIHWESLFH